MHDLSADGAWPVGDIRSFLLGAWSLSRTINDVRQNMPGVMQATAVIGLRGDGEGGDYVYSEEGDLSFGDYRETAHRTYLYTFPEPHVAEVLFDDGRPFYRLDLSDGYWTVDHVCDNDAYRGAFRADGPNVWRSNWYITGPDKEIVLDSRYQRVT